MSDFLIGFAFVAMVISPAIVAFVQQEKHNKDEI